MQTIDLTDYVVQPIGTWSSNRDFFRPAMLTLVEPTDGVTLAGPLRVRVCVQAQNSFNVIGTAVLSVQAKDLFSYVLDIPPGHTWTYHGLPFVLRETNAGPTAPVTGLPTTGLTPPAGTTLLAQPQALQVVSDPDRQVLTAIGRRLVPGVNDRLIVVIRPAGPDACLDPCAPYVDPCTPPKHDCHCGCKPCSCHTSGDDPSCDFAVGNTPDIGVFFPAACEPCTPGASIGMPALKGPSLIVPPARGGTVRTRYFNGMFMTSEDLETDQRNVRLKRALMNRALGQGVVWGLNVGLDGEAICVGPGYGVDCCGNDIVLSTPYRVDAQALLRDPAAAALLASRRATSAALVLEYFECPEQPRPVHGDPCAPDTTRCETSRIRETARLRLAPLCEIDNSGPINQFLAEIETLKRDPVVGPILGPATPKPQAGPLPIHVPFTVKFEAIDGVTGQVIGSQTLTPRVGANPGQDRARDDIGITNQFGGSLTVTIEAESGFEFTNFADIGLAHTKNLQGGVVVSQDFPIDLSTFSSPPTKLVFKPGIGTESLRLGLNGVPPPAQAEPIPVAFAFELRNWRMRDMSGQELTSAVTELQVTPLTFDDWQRTPWGSRPENAFPGNVPPVRVLHAQVLPSDVRAATVPPPIPCFSECDPTRPRFPVTFPFLHEDPTRPGRAADPRVLALALLYSFLAIESARNKAGTSQAVNSMRLQVATAIYNAAWRLFFATVPDTERFRLSDALQRLLRAWCCALLYPGPTCHCEPHGVVIGCAFVSGGHIQSVDPWGGRRWVVHYPLLSYWGQLFGITPFDAIASKLFGLICCIAGLPVPPTNTTGTGTGPGTPIFSAAGAPPSGGALPGTGRTSEVNFGRAFLVIAPRAEADARIAALELKPARTQSVSPVDFVSRFAEAIRVDGDPTRNRPLIHYTVLGLPDFHLLALGDPEPGPAPAREAGRLRDLVQAMLARRTGGKAVPPLLRTFTEDLSRNVIDAIPIEATDVADQATIAQLAAAGITRLGALLDRSPEDLHARVLKGENAEALAALVDRAEADATAVTKAVAEAIIAVSAESRVFARAGFREAERTADLAKYLEDKLTALELTVGATPADLVAKAAGDQ